MCHWKHDDKRARLAEKLTDEISVAGVESFKKNGWMGLNAEYGIYNGILL